MSRYKYKLNGIIRDTETNLTYNIDDIVKLLNEQDDQITELKSQLIESEKRIEDLEVELSNEKQRKELVPKLNKPILLVEDGSVDVDRLEEDGFYVIIYRQGTNKPEFLK